MNIIIQSLCTEPTSVALITPQLEKLGSVNLKIISCLCSPLHFWVPKLNQKCQKSGECSFSHKAANSALQTVKTQIKSAYFDSFLAWASKPISNLKYVFCCVHVCSTLSVEGRWREGRLAESQCCNYLERSFYKSLSMWVKINLVWPKNWSPSQPMNAR